MDHTGDDDDGASHDVASLRITEHVRVLRKITGQLEQVAVLLPALGRGVRLGLLEEVERISREGGDALHDLARTVNDIHREE